MVWSGSRRSSGRKAVKQVGGGVEALSPEARGQRGLDQKGAHDVVRRANHPLSLAVLRRGIRIRHTQLNTREIKKEREVELSNSRPLSHWTALMVRSNGVDTQAKKWRRVGKISDLARKEKVQE